MKRTQQPLPSIVAKSRPEHAAKLIARLSQYSLNELQRLYEELYKAPTGSLDRQGMTRDIAARLGEWARGTIEL